MLYNFVGLLFIFIYLKYRKKTHDQAHFKISILVLLVDMLLPTAFILQNTNEIFAFMVDTYL